MVWSNRRRSTRKPFRLSTGWGTNLQVSCATLPPTWALSASVTPVFECRTGLFPRWHTGCAHTSGAPHQTGHITWKPLSMLHRLVSGTTHLLAHLLSQHFFFQDCKTNKSLLARLFFLQVPLLVKLHFPRDFRKVNQGQTLGLQESTRWMNWNHGFLFFPFFSDLMFEKTFFFFLPVNQDLIKHATIDLRMYSYF